MRLIVWVHQIHAAGGGKWLHHGDGVVCRLLSGGKKDLKVIVGVVVGVIVVVVVVFGAVGVCKEILC